MLSYWALVIFVFVVLIDVAALLLDLCLLAARWRTITRHVSDSTLLIMLLISWQLIGAIALAVHLWAYYPPQ